ncbi:MAG: metal-dependent transcriptional regulator [Chloroflexia bacterium]|nr:metal-dependent transcriptional regulator [Chloroflexia bacterium]
MARDVSVVQVTPAMEDYLKGIYHLWGEAGPVTTQRLAEELVVSSPSVTNMVKRLHELGLAHHTRYQGVKLTAKGEQVALAVIRRHRLIERYLVESLGFPLDEAHGEAERLEHHVSVALQARLDAALGYPGPDPNDARLSRTHLQ